MPYADPDRRREFMREWMRWKRATDPRYREYFAAYARDPNRAEARRNISARRHANERARHFQVEGELALDEVADLFASMPACVYCGSADRLELDHVVPMSRGGLNRPENVVIACCPCNRKKYTGTHPDRWSTQHDACVRCGESWRPHRGRGLCRACHQRKEAA
jgi:5-methylcytosine-specific restriction endonuclease McrA